METVNLNSYDLEVTGLYGRNRTRKFTSTRLVAVPVGEAQPDGETLRGMATTALAGIKFRTGRWKVVRRPVERGEGYESISISVWGEPPLIEGGA